MPETGFGVELDLPFSCHAGVVSPVMQHGSLLLLRVINLIDIHEPEAERGQERIEARLDLILHWLGRQLFGSEPTPAPVRVRLAAGRMEWAAERCPDGPDVVLRLYPHPALAAPLELNGRIEDFSQGRAVATFGFSDEAASDAWTQWLFRHHRRAVHEARTRPDPD